MRLIMISNRLPVSVSVEHGRLRLAESAGGVASGIATYLDAFRKADPANEVLWVGWSGAGVSQDLAAPLAFELAQKNLYPVFLSERHIQDFYYGFCNDALWPLFHYFPSFVSYQQKQWKAYREVNELFGTVLREIMRPGDVVWIHDYHFLLLPEILRKGISGMTGIGGIPIGFFLHIPFPTYEIYRLLPDTWRRQLLAGMLAADLIGFHTFDYAGYFEDCVQRILGFERGAECAPETISLDGRSVKVGAFPIGIDFEKFNEGILDEAARARQRELRRATKGLQIILSVDRLDYTKGLDKRLRAYEIFLERNPAFRGKVVLEMIAVPSRTEIPQYQRMKKEAEELIGRINGRFGSVGWMPIVYQYRAVSPPELSALYASSDVALVTPLRDGMNLVAKEYVAARREGRGVLILSETAGAASEMGEAILVNPNHPEEIAAALLEALTMPRELQIERNELMRSRLKRYDIARWGNNFMQELNDFKKQQAKEREGKLLNDAAKTEILKDFKKSARKILLLDYDGTLAPFARYPLLAAPAPGLLELLRKLSEAPGTTVAITSGRDRATMEHWFGKLRVALSAEHGALIKEGRNQIWKTIKPLRNDWKNEAAKIMETFVDRVPGSFVEEKEFCLTWHYRMADQEMGRIRARELVSKLNASLGKKDARVVPGSKIVEVRAGGADKGTSALHFLKGKYDFILAVGDDATDEDMFKAVAAKEGRAIKVRFGETAAQYIVPEPGDILELLSRMVE